MATHLQDLTAQIDGIADTFVVAAAWIPGKLTVSFNGVQYRVGLDFSVVDATHFKMFEVPQAGDTLQVIAELPDSGTGTGFVMLTGVDPTIP